MKAWWGPRSMRAALTPQSSAQLDMLRGVAAFAVLTGHVRGLFFTDLQTLGGGRGRPFLSALYAATGLGHEAVMVFFVLSGFFIGGSVIKSVDRWSWTPYVVNRLTRLYLVLVPALVLTVVVDYVAHGLPAGSMFYDHPIAHFNDQPYAERDSLVTFLGNLAFLQTIVVSPFGSNSPLWSLANEFWYYALFPLVALVTAGRASAPRRLLYAALVVTSALWLPGAIVAAFAVWLFGVAVHFLPGVDAARRPLLSRMLAVAASVSVTATLAIANLHLWRPDVSDFAVGAAAAAVLYAIARIAWRQAPLPRLYVWLARRASRCSYSVYAVHFPLVMLIRVWVGPGTWRPTPLNLFMGVAIVAGIALCGAAFAEMTEARTEDVRRRVMAWLERHRAHPVVAQRSV
jgi:peptidoglycan/LPS O-acetylase OafA/YrhL